MTVNTVTMGDGTLKLGPAGVQNASGQVTGMACVPTEVVTKTPGRKTLDGSKTPDTVEVTIEWTLEGNVVQDIAAAGLVAYTWAQATNTIAFEFIPNTVAARKVTGTVTVVPLKLGGDVGTRPESDIKWRISGTPVLAAAP